MSAVTVVIGNYNYDRFLREAIDSALAQAGAPVIVIDDGSTDRSREIIASYGDRITMVFKENEGQSSVYNLGLALVKTEYVLFLDSDDVLYPTAVSEVLRAFGNGDYVKVQFRLDVIGAQGEKSGGYVPHSTPPRECGALLRRGWLYPSPPASGNVYRVSALRSVFPIPMSKQNRKAADFFAIYGVALTGRICALSQSLGGYRVHRKAQAGRAESSRTMRLAIGNAENENDLANSFPWRWETLRQMARTGLGEDLPPSFIDFSYEKSRLCARCYGASTGERWYWLMFRANGYFLSVVRNPFWGAGKKLGALGLTLLCLAPSRRVSNFAMSCISSPIARFAVRCIGNAAKKS
jgi:glycosyltransferase involved in cell wall biosynthesis